MSYKQTLMYKQTALADFGDFGNFECNFLFLFTNTPPTMATENNQSRKVLIVEPSLKLKLNKQTSSLSLESRHSIQSSYDSSRTYQRRVSFDNVTNISPAYQSFTLKQCSRGFERTRRSRTFIVAIDLDSNKIEPLIFALTVMLVHRHTDAWPCKLKLKL